MPKPSKRKGAPKPSSFNTNKLASNASTSDIPAPFIKVPETLTPFVSNLSKDHFYITSLDTHDRKFKRRLFHVPLFMNILLTIVVLYRIYIAIPTYFGILLSILGYDSPQKIDVKQNPATALVGIGIERTLMFLGDFMLVRFIGIWPVEFFLGKNTFTPEPEAGPVLWRRSVGYKDVEITVRRSRRWDASIFYKENLTGTGTVNAVDELVGRVKEEKAWKERIVPAVEKKWVKEKTGYQMLDKSWDLYFSGMIEAHALVDAGENKIEDFQTCLLVHTDRWGWLVWEVWREHGETNSNEGPQRLQLIKDGLTSVGKENLFFRTIEIIQDETSRSGLFTSERREQAVDKIRTEFIDQDVDFDDFWSRVGGIGAMPGLEVST